MILSLQIMLSPLMQGKLDVILEFINEEKKYLNITRQIRIIGENPKVSVGLSVFSMLDQVKSFIILYFGCQIH